MAQVLDASPSNEAQDSPGAVWRAFATNLSLITALVALVWYAIMANGYEQFYSPLGLSPADVGLSYAAILSNSVGAGFAVAANTLATSLVLTGFLFVVVRIHKPLRRVPFRRMFPTLLLLASVGTTIYEGYDIARDASNKAAAVRAEQVIRPHYVSPYSIAGKQLGFKVIVLHIRATQVVSIESTIDEGADRSPIEELQKRSLVHLGQADGVTVLYDVKTDSPVFVPSSNIVLVTSTYEP